MDEYSKTGAQLPNAAAKAREREMATKMRELLGIGDEALLIESLEKDYGVDRGSSRFDLVLKAWRSARQR